MLFENKAENDTIFELSAMRPMNSIFLGKLITGLAFTYSMLWMPLIFQFIFAFIAVSVLVPLTREFWSRQIKSIRLTDDYLEVVRGAKPQLIRIRLEDIKKVELVESTKAKRQNFRRRNSQKQQMATVLFERKKVSQEVPVHPESKCVITTVHGGRLEIEARYFLDGDFRSFLGEFKNAYHSTLGEANQAMELENSSEVAFVSQEDKKITRLLTSNEGFLKEDIEMKHELGNKLRAIYSTIYKVRNYHDISRMPKAHIIYEFRDEEDMNAYVIDSDYLSNLDEDSLEIGRNMIEACQKNLDLIETRINYYKKIGGKLKNIKFQQDTRVKLKGLRVNIENLQEKNTTKSIDHNLDTTSIEFENRILSELEDLTHQVHNLEDLEKAIILNEHISLFKD